MNDFYTQMMAQFGVQLPQAPQQQQNGYTPQSFNVDQGSAPSLYDTIFGMPQLGGEGTDFGGFRQTYANDPTNGYDYAPQANQNQAMSIEGLFGLNSHDPGENTEGNNSYSPYTY